MFSPTPLQCWVNTLNESRPRQTSEAVEHYGGRRRMRQLIIAIFSDSVTTPWRDC